MSHYFETPDTPAEEKTLTITCCDETLRITTARNVFARKGLDSGTALLARTMLTLMPEDAKRALDLGCGTGILGILLKKKHPSLDVWLLDINPRAVSLASRNCEQNGISCTVLRANGLTGVQTTFDLIVTNPPYHAGRNTVIHILREAWEHLTPQGMLLWVGRHQKGGKTIMTRLQEMGIPCETVERESGYRVYACRKTARRA